MPDATRPTVLLTLGRLPTAVDLARSFKANGWRVIVCDPFRWHLARTSRCVDGTIRVPSPTDKPDAFRQSLLDAIADWDVSLVVPVSEEAMHVAALETLVPETVTLFCAGQSDMLSLHSKRNFVELATRAGLPAPDTAASGTASATALLANNDCVVKPEYGCSGRGVQFLAKGSVMPEALQKNHVVQRRIIGDEYSALALARNGVVVGSVVYQSRVSSGSVAVAFERVDMPNIVDWMTSLVTANKHNGFIAFDFIVDAAGTAFAIECNPRATSGVHFFNTDQIAPGIVDGSTVTLHSDRLLQEFWSTWTQWWRQISDPSRRKMTWRTMRRARDVSWRRDDPWVFLLATFSTWPVIWRAMRHRRTFAEVLPLDIEWRDDHDKR